MAGPVAGHIPFQLRYTAEQPSSHVGELCRSYRVLSVHNRRFLLIFQPAVPCKGCLFFGSKTVKRSWIVSIAGLLVSALAVLPAQAEIKIGVVNASRLLQESPQAKAVQESLRNEFAPKQREVAALQSAL